MKAFTIVILFLTIQAKAYSISKTDSLLSELSKTIENKDQYLEEKWKRISLLNSMEASNQSTNDYSYNYSIYNKLFNEYKEFVYDSAMLYAIKMSNTAYALNNKNLVDRARIDIAYTLLSAGLFRETLDSLLVITPNTLDIENQKNYYFTLARAWYDLADYSEDSYYFNKYNDNGNVALEKAISLSDTTSAEYQSWQGWHYLRNQETEKARVHYEKLTKKYNLSKHQQAVATSSLSYIYMILGENEKSIEQLVIAAILDIQTSTKETVAFINLAEILYKKDKDEFSLVCINQALEDANFYGARHRKIKIAEILPIIQGNQLEIKERQRKIFLGYSLGLSLVVISMTFLIYTVLTQKKNILKAKSRLDSTIINLRDANKQLTEVNKIKEEYIGRFFSEISNYIEKLERFKKSISRNLSMKQYSNIEDAIHKIDLTSERDELYHSFDNTFVKLFPNFVGRFNSFFKEEDQIKVAEGSPFSPELRIYALIRLGIDDNERIARFLDYSLTTIYTYKAKLKKKAIVPSEDFEEMLMNIEIK